MSERAQAITALVMSALAFMVCFAAWTLNGVLVTFLVDNGVYRWDSVRIGWLIGLPILTGALARLPVGMLTDRFGGRKVYTILLLLSAVPMYLLGEARTFSQFAACSLGFGLSGASFAVGIAYTSVWFSKNRQGTALGVFGTGNAGSAITSFGAPTLLGRLTENATHIEGWRTLPKLYATALVVMAILFFLLTRERRSPQASGQGWTSRLAPLKRLRVWRFGLYYFLVFGCFVTLSQWLIPYYVGAYGMNLVTAGMLASAFSLPTGLIRALGGWLADRYGARAVMYRVFALSFIGCAALMVPRMFIESPGPAVMAFADGIVSEVSAERIVVSGTAYAVKVKPAQPFVEPSVLVLPHSTFWQEPVVKAGDKVVKRQLLAKGVTQVFFQANVWIFTFLVFAVGIVWGIGMAAVYKYIPDYFPSEVGVVGGLVGVIGGLGGFVGPILFGYILRATGLWTSMWFLLAILSLGCFVWLHAVVRRILREQAPAALRGFD